MADKKISALTAATTPLAGTEVLPIVQSGSTVKVSVANLTTGRAVSASSVTTTGEVSSSGALRITGSYSTNAASQIAIQNSAGVGGLYINGSSTGSGNRGTFVMWQQDSAGANYLQTLGVDVSANITFNTGNLVQGTAAKGVNFTANTGAAGMTSQLLNWYEEGTFTPTLNATGFSGATYSTQVGRYTRIGRQVTVQVYVVLSALTSGGSNYLRIEGLPFASASGVPSTGCSVYSDNLTSGSSGNYIIALISGGQSEINLFEIGPNGNISSLGMQGSRLTATSVFVVTATYIV